MTVDLIAGAAMVIIIVAAIVGVALVFRRIRLDDEEGERMRRNW